ncbi:hypothetical protein MauCBS54593_003604 [Microsporum audouinii]
MAPNLETIPEEIFLRIIEEAASPLYADTSYYRQRWLKLKQYLTVSRRWQRTIERFSFNWLSVDNTNISTFAALFRETEAHRKAYVKRLGLAVVLPEYDGEDYQRHKEVHNELFSDFFLKLFQVLETFNDDEDVKRSVRRGEGMELTMENIYSPSDDFDADHRYKIYGTHIQLLNFEKLPTLSCVSMFFSGVSSYSRKIYPVSSILIAAKLKDVKTAIIQYENNPAYISDGTREIMRPAFTRALSEYTHPLETLWIRMHRTYPSDEAIPPPNYVPSSTGVDPTNLALHDLIQRTKLSFFTIDSCHILSPELFWPYGDSETAPTPFWQNLKNLSIGASSATPDGDWYFVADTSIASYSEFIGVGNDSEDSNEPHDNRIQYTVNIFRTIPNSDRMNPLLLAMARAVRHAPSLEKINLNFNVGSISSKYVKINKENRDFDIYYCVRGTDGPCRQDPKSMEKNTLICEVKDWRPSKEVENYWKDVLGPDGVIVYR